MHLVGWDLLVGREALGRGSQVVGSRTAAVDLVLMTDVHLPRRNIALSCEESLWHKKTTVRTPV